MSSILFSPAVKLIHYTKMLARIRASDLMISGVHFSFGVWRYCAIVESTCWLISESWVRVFYGPHEHIEVHCVARAFLNIRACDSNIHIEILHTIILLCYWMLSQQNDVFGIPSKLITYRVQAMRFKWRSLENLFLQPTALLPSYLLHISSKHLNSPTIRCLHFISATRHSQKMHLLYSQHLIRLFHI